MRKEVVEFNGRRYYRFPDSPHKHLQRYYWPDRTARGEGAEVLHREIWKGAHGEIPGGCLIHHRDGDWLNNEPSNLECVTRKAHAARHPEGYPSWLEDHLNRIREKATAWHRSEEGRAWHREHGARVWKNRQPKVSVCEYCHQPFEHIWRSRTTRFCSRRCGQSWYKAHGTYALARRCERCGKEFSTSRFKPARTCGKKCAAALRISEGTHGRSGSKSK